MLCRVCVFLVVAAGLYALPEGGEVRFGEASLARSDHCLTVVQASEKAIIQWDRFDIASQEAVCFAQGSAQAAVLNRVAGGDLPSRIDGRLSANGQVFLVNPAGVVVGPSGRISAARFVALAYHVSDECFLSGMPERMPVNAGGIVEIGGIIEAEEVIARGGIVDVLDGAVLEASDGGQILVWGEQGARCAGRLAARGGMIEVSSPGVLEFSGTADTGGTGFLLLDPSSIEIGDFGGVSNPIFPTTPPGTYNPTAASCQLDAATVGSDFGD